MAATFTPSTSSSSSNDSESITRLVLRAAGFTLLLCSVTAVPMAIVVGPALGMAIALGGLAMFLRVRRLAAGADWVRATKWLVWCMVALGTLPGSAVVSHRRRRGGPCPTA